MSHQTFPIETNIARLPAATSYEYHAKSQTITYPLTCDMSRDDQTLSKVTSAAMPPTTASPKYYVRHGTY